MSQPVSVFVGEVMHRRLFPVEYRFSYRVFSVAIDLMQLDQLGRQNPLLSLNRFNLLSFYTRDHGAEDGKGLIAWANETLRQAGAAGSTGKDYVVLLSPRIRLYL